MCAYRLTFTLPRTVSLLAQPGRHQPCLHGCVLEVERCGLVTIKGPSRESLFEQTRRFVRILNKGRPPLEIQAWVTSPDEEFRVGVRDRWKIIVDAEVAITPASSLPSTLFPREQDQQQNECAS